MDRASLKPVIESLIFASDAAITLDKLVGVLEGTERAEIRAALKELMEEYEARGGGFLIEEVAGGYRFRTNAEFSPWIRRLFKIGGQRISKAAMETLAIVAYRQPMTRGEIEQIRGVDSGGVLATLMDKRFIRIVGRKELPGRPVVYGTTKEFLETFDLKDLSCLPSLKDIQSLEEENASQERGPEETEERRTEGAEVAEDRSAEEPEAGDEGAGAEDRPGGTEPPDDGEPEEPGDPRWIEEECEGCAEGRDDCRTAGEDPIEAAGPGEERAEEGAGPGEPFEDGPDDAETETGPEEAGAEETGPEAGAETDRAPAEAHSGRGGDVPQEGRGPDTRGQGEGQRGGGDGAGGEG